MRLQPFAKINHAHNSGGDGDHQQDQGQHGKCRQRTLRGSVVFRPRRCVHSDKLEDEVRHGCEVNDDDGSLSRFGFGPADVGCEEEDDDGNRNGGDCEIKLGAVVADDYHDELDGKAEEEKEIKLEEGDVNLSKGTVRSDTKVEMGDVTDLIGEIPPL